MPQIYRSSLSKQSMAIHSSSAFILRLSVVTGSGHHSTQRGKGDKSRVYNAVVGLCDEIGLNYSPIRDPKGYIGGVLVDVSDAVFSLCE